MASTRKKSGLPKALSLIKKHKRFLVAAHQVPDGDALGSEMALHEALKRKKKTSVVLNADPTPEKFRIVDPKGQIQLYRAGEKLPPFDVAFVVDTHDWKMLGLLEGPLKKAGKPVVFIDHHAQDVREAPRGDSELLVVDESFGSTAELVHALISKLGVKLDLPIAVALYTALLTDTGGFRFRRTSPKSHRLAALLLEAGVSTEKVYQAIFGQESPEKLRLFGSVLEALHLAGNGKIAWISIPLEARRRYRASVEDTESFVNQLTLLAGVEIAILFREEEDGRIKLSFRGIREIPVLDLARSFGGGGHHYASGARVVSKLETLIPQVLQRAEETLAKA